MHLLRPMDFEHMSNKRELLRSFHCCAECSAAVSTYFFQTSESCSIRRKSAIHTKIPLLHTNHASCRELLFSHGLIHRILRTLLPQSKNLIQILLPLQSRILFLHFRHHLLLIRLIRRLPSLFGMTLVNVASCHGHGRKRRVQSGRLEVCHARDIGRSSHRHGSTGTNATLLLIGPFHPQHGIGIGQQRIPLRPILIRLPLPFRGGPRLLLPFYPFQSLLLLRLLLRIPNQRIFQHGQIIVLLLLILPPFLG
mmetsp:Transcript_14982/g.26800  ORF Transcript_14982/g.26800 Transcript_14982/m.26800 type:complete len:252 (+) Transcript_14982:150-905(+)